MGAGLERSEGIAVDSSGNAYVTGSTSSTNFPVTPGAYQNAYGGGTLDGFVAKVNVAGSASTSLVYSTYLGRTGSDYPKAVAVDGSGNGYVTGGTTSLNFPMVLPVQPVYGGGNEDGFLSKLNAAGNALTFSSYLGGTGYERSNGIAVDGAGSIYVTGEVQSIDFPRVNPFQSTFGGIQDGFVAKIAFPPSCVDPPNTTMVAWYPFDETVGTTAANLATGNIGTLTNSPTHVPGKVAGALRFDGNNDYVESPSTIVTNIGPAGIPPTCSGSYSTCRGDFSIDAWINVDPTASVSAITIVDKRSGPITAIKGYTFFVYSRNRLGPRRRRDSIHKLLVSDHYRFDGQLAYVTVLCHFHRRDFLTYCSRELMVATGIATELA